MYVCATVRHCFTNCSPLVRHRFRSFVSAVYKICQYITLKIIHSITFFIMIFHLYFSRVCLLCPQSSVYDRCFFVYVSVFVSFNIIKIISLVVDPFFRFFFHLNVYVIFCFVFRQIMNIFFSFLTLLRFASNILFDLILINQRTFLASLLLAFVRNDKSLILG